MTGTEGPVTNTDQSLLGFSYRGKLRPIQNYTTEIGSFIAADFANRFSAGEKRLLKCKKSEHSALTFILVDINFKCLRLKIKIIKQFLEKSLSRLRDKKGR